MSRPLNQKLAGAALEKCHTLGLHPTPYPMGDAHHTEAAASSEDRAIGDALAYFLGGLFVDRQCDPDRPHRESFYYSEMTSVDVWTRVARALRIHGLTITDIPSNDDGTQPEHTQSVA